MEKSWVGGGHIILALYSIAIKKFSAHVEADERICIKKRFEMSHRKVTNWLSVEPWNTYTFKILPQRIKT